MKKLLLVASLAITGPAIAMYDGEEFTLPGATQPTAASQPQAANQPQGAMATLQYYWNLAKSWFPQLGEVETQVNQRFNEARQTVTEKAGARGAQSWEQIKAQAGEWLKQYQQQKVVPTGAGQSGAGSTKAITQ